MKQFSHLIHSHPLFILLGETETLGFSSPRDPGTPSILMSKEKMPSSGGVNPRHSKSARERQGVQTKVSSAGYPELK